MNNKLLTLTVGLALLGLTACGGGDDKKPAKDKAAAGGGAAKPTGDAYDKAKGTGTVKITVKYMGAAPEASLIVMNSSDSCASHNGKMPVEKSQVLAGGLLPHAFVWAVAGPHEKLSGYDASAKKVLDQKDCVYSPHVLGVMVNQLLTLKNSDPTSHNVHTHPAKNKEVNLPQATGKSDDIQFSKAEEAMGVSCDTHSWMNAHIFVLKHPFSGTTDTTTGSTTITGLYPGKYTFKVWHESFAKTGAEKSVEVEVKDGATAEATVELGK